VVMMMMMIKMMVMMMMMIMPSKFSCPRFTEVDRWEVREWENVWCTWTSRESKNRGTQNEDSKGVPRMDTEHVY
jgi:hypothetical protein